MDQYFSMLQDCWANENLHIPIKTVVQAFMQIMLYANPHVLDKFLSQKMYSDHHYPF